LEGEQKLSVRSHPEQSAVTSATPATAKADGLVEARPAPGGPGAPRRGLTTAEAAERRRQGSSNLIGARSPGRLVRQLLQSLTQPLVLLLVAVAIGFAALGRGPDGLLVVVVALAVVLVESWTRWRADRAIIALTRLSAPRALVWRDAKLREMAPDELVMDDMVLLKSGSRVPADGRLVESRNLMIDESVLTGESQPVERGVGPHENAKLLGGSSVVRGWGVAVVTAVGRESTLGQVAAMIGEAETPDTPLQIQMTRLGRRLLLAAVLVSVIVAASGALRGQAPAEMLTRGLTLTFASVPAELPILVMVLLGLGSRGLARQGAIVRKLSAAETLGSTTLICTDKTGTLTENRVTLTGVLTASEVLEPAEGQEGKQDRLGRVMHFAQLASEPTEESWLADPTDVAVWRSASWDWPDPIARFSFDSSRRLASGLTQLDGHFLVGVKGAPEAVLVRSASWYSAQGVEFLDSEQKSRVLTSARQLAAGGARVLAVASRSLVKTPSGGPSRLEEQLTFEGLMAFDDPLRPEVPGAVRELQRAGVRVTMITGDQPATANSIARSAGLSGPVLIAAQAKVWTDQELAKWVSEGCIVARARPEDKLRIVRAAAGAGEIVAVTGDGVNDAPALEAAAIGVAMGRTGADVAREAADLVLSDDSFATLVRAMGQGRRLYENLRKAIRYYLGVKLALVAVSLLIAAIGLPLPFLPLHIMIIELLIGLGAAIAFVNQAPEGDEMNRPPRNPRAPFFDRRLVTGILTGGLTLAGLAGGAFLLGYPWLGLPGARCLALITWLIGHVALGVAMGWERRRVTIADLRANPALVLWGATAAGLVVLLVAIPPVQALLQVGPVPPRAAAVAVLAGAILPFWLEIPKRLSRLRALT
jgi:P-type Ca2+ transporter type 2C